MIVYPLNNRGRGGPRLLFFPQVVSVVNTSCRAIQRDEDERFTSRPDPAHPHLRRDFARSVAVCCLVGLLAGCQFRDAFDRRVDRRVPVSLVLTLFLTARVVAR